MPDDSLSRLIDVSKKLAAPMDLSSLLDFIVDTGRQVLGAERGSILLYDPSRHELFSKVATGVGPLRMDADAGIAGACARSRAILNVSDVYADPRFNGNIDRSTGFRTRSMVSVPLIGLEEELVGVMQVLNAKRGDFNAEDESLAAVLGSHATVAIQRERLLAGHLARLKMERDLDAARSIQQGILPKILHTPRGYGLAALSRPAAQTGGDIYDIIPMGADNAAPIALLLADASGHGIGPALSVVQVRAMLRMGLRLRAPLRDIVRQIDAQLLNDLRDDHFVTAFVGHLDPVRHALSYHAAGQGPMLHYHTAENYGEWHGASAIPLGVTEVWPRELARRISLSRGDFVVLVTDGVYECTNAAGEPFGKDHIHWTVAHHQHAGAQGVLEALFREVDQFTGDATQADDLTAIVIQRL